MMALIAGLRLVPVAGAAGPQSGSTVAPGLKGQITRLTVTPNPVNALAPTELRVEGGGRCSLSLDFGDGTRGPGIAGAVLPLRVPYQYALGGGRTG
jgi:hypothetical protein